MEVVDSRELACSVQISVK